MIIKKCHGYELEKEKRNTSEDFFNRSEVTFLDGGEEKTLRVLYIRYFDEKFSEFTPFAADPVAAVGNKQYEFKDIVALVCLLNNPAYRERKRVYINSEKEFAACFQEIDVEKMYTILRAIEENGGYQVS